MDMNDYIPKWLTNTELEAMPDHRYEGRVLRVEPGRVFNSYKLTKEDVPVLVFEDGWSWIPNIGARKALTKAWGGPTDDWIGRRMAIYLKSVTRMGKASGRLEERFEKQVEVLDDDEG